MTHAVHYLSTFYDYAIHYKTGAHSSRQYINLCCILMSRSDDSWCATSHFSYWMYNFSRIRFYSSKKTKLCCDLLCCDCVQYQVGQLFSVAETSKNETGGGEGIQVLKNEPYEEKGEKGQYTHKLYHIKRYVGFFFPPVIFLTSDFFVLQLHKTTSRWQCWLLFLKKRHFSCAHFSTPALFIVDVLSRLCISPLSLTVKSQHF